MHAALVSWRISRRMWSCLAAACALPLAFTAAAQVVPVGTAPVVGSSNPVAVEPPVTRPSTTPCVVSLFTNQAFNTYSPHPISYMPPAGCTGPWAKVVLSLDFTVTKGIQYDRTASLYLGNANIFYGTTAEPSSNLSHSWHVERDVTDLSAIFATAQSGQAIINNIFNSTYTGGIYATAALQFYPANLENLPPVVPAAVVPVSGANAPFELDTTASQLTTTFTAPRNTIKAYLDVISQSQSSDEFWYLDAPSNVASELETSGNTAFRETEITVDGKPAGVAPVSPWIFTGGIDPNLWIPIAGVQTLNFKPYRVDLTPFAGVLADGQPHTVGISVYNASSFFLGTANLLLYTDPVLKQTTGEVMENTLSAAPVPDVAENLTKGASGAVIGTVDVSSRRDFTIRGYVNTSQGRTETTVKQKVNFLSAQIFNVGANEYQDLTQTSTVNSTVTTTVGAVSTAVDSTWSFPLTLNYSFIGNADGTYTQKVSSDQHYATKATTTQNGLQTGSTSLSERVNTSDTEQFNSSLTAVTAVGPAASTGSYASQDAQGHCVQASFASASGVLTKATSKAGCPAQ